jgi:hypothetical protein
MVYFIRIILIGLIIYLVVRMFSRYFDITRDPDQVSGQNGKNNPDTKKVSKETGEFVDYEEVD